MEIQLALQSDNRQSYDLVARCRYLFHLHLAFSAHEQDFAVGVEFLHLVGNGYGREDVPSRTASAYDDSQCFVLFHNNIILLDFAAFELVQIVQAVLDFIFRDENRSGGGCFLLDFLLRHLAD